MRVALMQPTFIPWQGLFELILSCDVFVFLDDFQFSYQSFGQRNKLFVNKGQVDWYTVPVEKTLSFKQQYNVAKINYKVLWRDKFWKRIQNNYSRAPFFDCFADSIKKWLYNDWTSLGALNIEFIRYVCHILNAPLPEFRLSSHDDSNRELKRSERVLELLCWCNADQYLSAYGSFDYMHDDGVFPVNDIEVLFQDFRPKPYKQIGSPDLFIPYLSVADALFNVGPERTLQLIESGTDRWLTWHDMTLKTKVGD